MLLTSIAAVAGSLEAPIVVDWIQRTSGLTQVASWSLWVLIPLRVGIPLLAASLLSLTRLPEAVIIVALVGCYAVANWALIDQAGAATFLAQTAPAVALTVVFVLLRTSKTQPLVLRALFMIPVATYLSLEQPLIHTYLSQRLGA